MVTFPPKKSFYYLHFGSWPYSKKRVKGREKTHFVINKWIDSYTDQNEGCASEQSTVTGAEEKVRGTTKQPPND